MVWFGLGVLPFWCGGLILLKLIDEAFEALAKEERSCLGRLVDLCREVDSGGPAAPVVERLISNLDGLFLLVVVGEVNSGKSALINEILEDQVCPEGPIPVTDRVCILQYGAESADLEIDEFTRRRSLRHDLLSAVSIVDTPGTNSVVRDHQRITEEFIPRADLVLFVTSIDRAFTESEREFLSLIRTDWQRKVFFVLSKVDTREPSEVQAVIEYVRRCSQECLDFDPPILPVSVKAARGGSKSGMSALREYLRENLSEGERVRLKLSGPVDAGIKVVADLREDLGARQQELGRELDRFREIEESLGESRERIREGSFRYLSELHDLLAEFDARGRRFLAERIRLPSLSLLSQREKFRAAFRREVVADLEERISELLRSGAEWLIRELEETWRGSLLALERDLVRRGEVSPTDREASAEARGSVSRARVLHQVRKGVDEELACYDSRVEADRILGQVLKGGAGFLGVEASAATVGAVLVVLVKTALVTGVVVASAVAASGFLILPVMRARAIRVFSDRVAELTVSLKGSFSKELEGEIDSMIATMRGSFAPYSTSLEERGKDLGSLWARTESLLAELDSIRERIG